MTWEFITTNCCPFAYALALLLSPNHFPTDGQKQLKPQLEFQYPQVVINVGGLHSCKWSGNPAGEV